MKRDNVQNVLIVTKLILIIVYAASSKSKDAITVLYYSNMFPNDTYAYGFETDTTGIRVQEEKRASIVQGSFSYTSPEGILITLTYTADETGFHPRGLHLPTPPPVPEAIQRALAWIEEQKKDDDGIKESFFGNNLYQP